MIFCLGFLVPGCGEKAAAHWSSDSYLTVLVTNRVVRLRWEIPLRDLDLVLGLDKDGDGTILEREWKSKEEEVLLHGSTHLGVRIDGVVGALEPSPLVVAEHLDGMFAVLNYLVSGIGEAKELELDYRLFDGLDPHHRGLIQVICNGLTQTAVLDRFEPQQKFFLTAPSSLAQFIDFARKGIWHIATGYDHLLFLCALLLPSVLCRVNRRWEPVKNAREALWRVVRVVTAFTFAHSITLSIAALGLIRLPGKAVEIVIAISVAIAAINNLRPLVVERGWIIAFVFGLVHGFGFASALTEFGLNGPALWLALGGFNAGVEVGQLACVAAFFPVASLIRQTNFYSNWFVRGGSVIILVLALIWAMERTLDCKWLPF